LARDQGFFVLDERTMRTVFYTEIDASGNFQTPSGAATTSGVWAMADPLPLIGGKVGLWQSAAAVGRAAVGGGQSTTFNTAIYVAGGYHDTGRTDLNQYVYRAIVNNDGSLTWSTTPGEGNSQVVVEARGGMSMLAYNNKLYLIGGSTSNADSLASRSVMTAFFDEDLNILETPGLQDTFFVGTDSNVLPDENWQAGVALVPGIPNAQGVQAAWALVLGGFNEAGTIQQSSFRGSIGGADEADASIRTSEGWYYSSVLNILIEDRIAQLLSIRWAAEIDRSSNTNADIQIEFRKTVTPTASAPRRISAATMPKMPGVRWTAHPTIASSRKTTATPSRLRNASIPSISRTSSAS
jgi:hypothetical protein